MGDARAELGLAVIMCRGFEDFGFRLGTAVRQRRTLADALVL